VITDGLLLNLTQIRSWSAECETLRDTLKGKASLGTIEPNLQVVLESKGLGHIEISIDISPDTLSQEHRFLGGTDQSYLPGLIRQEKTLLGLYPIVGDKFLRTPVRRTCSELESFSRQPKNGLSRSCHRDMLPPDLYHRHCG
jgi:hypothetical protein